MIHSSKKCLIIDDDPDDQEIFIMCAEKVNRTVECLGVKSGIDALKMLNGDREYVPDYIFLDVNMPKMNGIDCLKELKKISRLRNTKIFMYSTTSEPEFLDASKKLGAWDFIVKPTKTTELKERLNKIFEAA
jgi:CheY-like chemotaxis protein